MIMRVMDEKDNLVMDELSVISYPSLSGLSIQQPILIYIDNPNPGSDLVR